MRWCPLLFRDYAPATLSKLRGPLVTGGRIAQIQPPTLAYACVQATPVYRDESALQNA
jgi:hypothetical protein